MHQFRPQFPIENMNSKSRSESENPICNKPRTCEITYHPSTKIPVATTMTGNFKTQQCSNFKFGRCRYGNKCLFAHGIDAARHCLPNLRLQRSAATDVELGSVWNGLHGSGNPSNICKMFYFRKECTYGDKCRFLHGIPENTFRGNLGHYRENSYINMGNRGFREVNRTSLKPEVKKYRLCIKWQITGTCPYGNMCCFLHGFAELEKPAGHIELVSGILPAKFPRIPAGGKDVIRTCYKRQAEEQECAFKRKKVEKINGIYADWIEENSLPAA